MSTAGIIGIIPTLFATVALVHILRSFNGKDYHLDSTKKNKTLASKRAKTLRDQGLKVRVTKSGKQFKVWKRSETLTMI